MIPNQNDFTNGLSFWKWLIAFNKLFVFGALPIALFMITAAIIYQSTIAALVLSGLLIIYYFLLRWEYKKGQKGEAM